LRREKGERETAMRACTVVLACIAAVFLLEQGVGLEEEADALINIDEASSEENEPFTTPMRDYESLNAHTSDVYKEKMQDYVALRAMEKNQTSKQAVKYTSIINDLELSRAEACKHVLVMHAVPIGGKPAAQWKVEPKVDTPSGHVPGGYDSPMVPLRKLLSEKATETNLKPSDYLRPSDTFAAEYHLVLMSKTELGEVQTNEAASAAANTTANATVPTWHSMAAEVKQLSPLAKNASDEEAGEVCQGDNRWLEPCQKIVTRKRALMEKIGVLEAAMRKESRVKEECIPFMASLMDRKNAALERYFLAAKKDGITNASNVSDYHPQFTEMSEQYFKDLKNETYLERVKAAYLAGPGPMPARYGGVPDYKSPHAAEMGPDRRGGSAEKDAEAAEEHRKRSVVLAEKGQKELHVKGKESDRLKAQAFQQRLVNISAANAASDNEQDNKLGAMATQYDQLVADTHMPTVQQPTDGDGVDLTTELVTTLIEEEDAAIEAI
jgi:hypothetical protein